MASNKQKSSIGKQSSRKAALDASGAPIVVYIHGIGEQVPNERLKRQWDLALFGKLMGDRTRMAYWADIVGNERKPAAPGAGKKSGNARRSAEGPLDPAEIVRDAGIVGVQAEEATAFIAALAASLPSAVVTGDPTRSGKSTRVLPLPAFLRRPIARAFLKAFLTDVAVYLYDAARRKAIQQRLAAQIPGDGEPFVLVSHSLGSVVAFEQLNAARKRADAAAWATLGSPLGIQEVQDELARRHALMVPERVHAWHNFADRLDPVAIDVGLANDYEPRGAIGVIDHRVDNERTRDLLRFNPHSAIGYLANATVRAVLHGATRYDAAGRFIVARDVAEEFVDPERRQPVLIEVLHPRYWACDETKEAMRVREEAQAGLGTLGERVNHLANAIGQTVRDVAQQHGVAAEAEFKQRQDAARVMRLRKYVAAHLTVEEIATVAEQHADLNVYAFWRSAQKKKLIRRSLQPLSIDAARGSYGAQGKGITWAVLDTGVRRDHPHFSKHQTVVEVLDCTTVDDTPVPDDEAGDGDGHGTHVCGIIAGESEDDEGQVLAGMAPKAKLVVYKVLDDDGNGEDAWIIKAIDDIHRRNAAGSGVKVHGVNLSLGGPFDATVYGCGYSPICKELRDLWRQGSVVCVAAGNEGRLQVSSGAGDIELNAQMSIGDPANLEDCIAVGSVNADRPHLYGVSYFSSRGPTADGRPKPDVVAPGERITSCNARFRKSGSGARLKFASLHRADSGTSMACPHVSGLIAAFLSARREFIGRPDEVKRILIDNCNDLGRDRYHQGAGMPNLMKMLLNV